MKLITSIAKALAAIISSPFQSDMDVMSPEAKKILSNEEDKKKYLDALEYLRTHPSEQKRTIKLSNQEEITLVS